MANPTQTEWSFASISEGRNEKRLCRSGDVVGNRVVSGITWRYLFLRGDRDECFVDLFGEQKNLRKKGARSSGKRLSRKAMRDGIRKIGANERAVDRSVLDQALANPARFARSVRVRPYKKNGEVVGFRLRRVKGNSPLAKLGARRGDIIHSVNGVPLTSVDKALTVYQNMRNESRLVFSITRKGKPQELTIHIE